MSKPQYIDIHAHVNFSAFDADRKAVIERALQAGIWVMNVGTQEATSKKAVEIANAFPKGVFAVIGLHPIHVNASFHDSDELGSDSKGFTSRGEEFDKDFYKDLIKMGGKKVVAIGECGLDYYRAPSVEEMKRQKDAFVRQIELAIESDLPLMLHVRNAYKDVLEILKPFKERYGSKLRGDVHFFAGDLEEARAFLDLGFYLSFTGVITFAREYESLVKAVPLDRLMTETDSPYVAPTPQRGKRNEPLFVAYVTDKAADIRSEDPAAFRKAVVENALDLFKLTS